MVTDYPALNGQPVTERHARICREQGHATHTVDGADSGTCPRCGEATTRERFAVREVRQFGTSRFAVWDVLLDAEVFVGLYLSREMAEEVLAHLIPINEAAHVFVGKGGSYLAASAYLPAAYDHCTKCDTGQAHEHPRRSLVSEAEIDSAVRRFHQDEYETEIDA